MRYRGLQNHSVPTAGKIVGLVQTSVTMTSETLFANNLPYVRGL
jgi:hypothetical protein